MSYRHDRVAKSKRRLRETGNKYMSTEQHRRLVARRRFEAFLKGKNL